MTVLSNLKKRKSTWENNPDVTEAFAAEYISIAKLDLNTGLAVVLKSDMDLELEGAEIPWRELVERYVRRRVFPEDKSIVLGLTLDKLTAYFDKGEPALPVEVRCLSEKEQFDWMKVSGIAMSGENRQLLITTRLYNEDRIMRKIIDLFVYNNFDYFVLLNAKTNSYLMFNGKSGTPLPPSSGNDYDEEVARYNKKYVVPEDVDESIANMSISHVLSMLEKQDSYAITMGSINDEGEYRRSRIQYTYYDRAAGLILLTRMDVTQMYLEEKAKEERLMSALREAQHDSMTELYNKKAINELIGEVLRSQYRAQAAIFFVDIDNFKLVNDTLGHQKGDELLRYLGRILKNIAGKNGIAGRMGGDEFLLFIPVGQNMERIRQYAQDICLSFSNNSSLGIGNLPVSCSIGISIYPQDGTEFENLLYKADQALYDAKRYGKCQYSFYSSPNGESKVESE